MRKPGNGVLLLTLLLLSAACGESRPTPTSPSVPAPAGSGVDLSVRLEVTADTLGSADPVAALSEVVAETSSSPSPPSGPLTVSIDFGDGTITAAASARHVYRAPGSFTITATVSDGQSRKASATQQIAVRDATGNWFQAGYVARTKRVEVRRLSIDAQTGTTVRGSYRVTGNADRTFTGTLIPPRDIRMTANDGVSLIGTLPGRLNADAVTWALISAGDSTDGQRLEFHAITGVLDAASPVADMTLRFGHDLLAPFPALTPIQVDGAASRGADLSYFIEFGDGAVATTSQASRVIDVKESSLTARLTVVDRFGRSDSRSREYSFFQMPAGGGGDSWYTFAYPMPNLSMVFPSRSGTTYSAWVSNGGNGSAVLSGDGDIRITIPAVGIEYRGKVTVGETWEGTTLTVAQHGGPDDGRTWVLRVRWYS